MGPLIKVEPKRLKKPWPELRTPDMECVNHNVTQASENLSFDTPQG